MTVASATSTISYAGNDSTTEFSFPYYFLDDGDLVVYIVVDSTSVPTIKTISTHYTVSGAGNVNGGTVTMLTAPATGETLHIQRWVTPTQGVDYVENDDFPAETHEQALDRLTMLVQQSLNRTGGTSFNVGATDFMSLDATDLSAWDADSKRIGSSADAVDATDLVTLQQLQAAEVSGGNLPSVTGDDKFLVSASGAWTVLTLAQTKTQLGYGTAASVDTGTDPGDVPLNSDLGTAAYVATGTTNGTIPVLGATGLPAVSGENLTGILGEYILVIDTKAANTAGGGFTSGSWQTRTLNSLVTDETGSASLGSNQLTLPAGTYYVRAMAQAYGVDGNIIRIYDTTGTAVLAQGITAWAWSTATNVATAMLEGKFTLGTPSALELQHNCATTQATNGFGLPANIGEAEVYAMVQFWKVK